MADINGRRYVTYPFLWSVVSAVLAGSVTVTLFVVGEHANRPIHSGGVPRTEIQQFERRIDQGFTTLSEQIRDLKTEIRKR